MLESTPEPADRRPVAPPPPTERFDPFGLLRRRREAADRSRSDEVSVADISGLAGNDPFLTAGGLSVRALWRWIRRRFRR